MALVAEFTKKLDNSTLEISLAPSDTPIGLVGGSGAGKSMTLKCIAGLETPDEGEISLHGQVVFSSTKKINLPPQQRKIGYLFQKYALFPKMTVSQNIAMGAHNQPHNAQQIEQYLTQFRLEGRKNALPHQLSGGEQQRTALARLLASQPAFLLLDEPFSALDGGLQQEMVGLFGGILSSVSGIVVSHRPDEVLALCPTAYLLEHGKTHNETPTKQLISAPPTVASAKLFGAENILPIVLLNQFTTEQPPETATDFMVPTQHLQITLATEGDWCVSHRQSYQFYELATFQKGTIFLTKRYFTGEIPPNLGDRANITLDFWVYLPSN